MRGQIAAIVGLVFFVILGGLTGYLAWDGMRKVGGSEGVKGLRTEVEEARRERERQAVEVAKQEALLGEQRVEEMKGHVDVLLARCEYEGLVLEQGTVERLAKVAEDWSKSEAVKGNVTADLAAEVEKETGDRRTAAQESNTKQIKGIIDRIKDMAEQGKQSREKAAGEMQKLSREKGRLEKERDERRIRIEQLVNREPVIGGGALPPVGQVLESSSETRTAVISIGGRLGVKRGMRFEVYQVRYGNRRVGKGYVEVKSVGPETSTCGIIVREVVLPRCPVCSYTAEQPEEQYCPRCTAPGSPQAYQRLLGSPKVEVTGSSLTDPIVKGDLVYNPLFKLGGGRRFVVAGEGLVEGKDYEKANVERVVQSYGGVVEKELGSGTEAVIALRGGKEVVGRAQELGVPIVREFELFRYLEK